MSQDTCIFWMHSVDAARFKQGFEIMYTTSRFPAESSQLSKRLSLCTDSDVTKGEEKHSSFLIAWITRAFFWSCRAQLRMAGSQCKLHNHTAFTGISVALYTWWDYCEDSLSLFEVHMQGNRNPDRTCS